MRGKVCCHTYALTIHQKEAILPYIHNYLLFELVNMLLGSVQIAGEELGVLEIKDICQSLKNNSIRMLSLRGCQMDDSCFQKLTESLKGNTSLAQLNLNLGVVNSKERIGQLTEGLIQNDSISSLLLHGTPLQDEGMSILVNALSDHPKLQSLDLGDCKLGDDGLSHVCSLLEPTGNRTGLLELTLTGNQDITQAGWAQLAMAIANGCSLTSLFLDYTNIGDFGAGIFAVALAASKTIKIIDFEGCGISDTGAELLYDLVETYDTPLVEINLAENKISEELLNDLKHVLSQDGHRLKDALPKRRSSPQGKAEE